MGALTATYQDVLGGLAERDERIVVLTAENRAAIRGLPARLGPRFADVGIAEQTLVGVGAGLALRGRIPVAHALAAFLTMRAFEFVRTDVGIGQLPVKLVGYVPGVLSEANGPTHQALEDVALMSGIPGMRVFCPADEEDLLLGLPQVLFDPHPWYVRFNTRPAAFSRDGGPDAFQIGKAETAVPGGDDVVVLTYGALVTEACDAAHRLADAGVSAGVLSMRTLAPLDREAVLAAAGRARLVVTLEDHLQAGGLYTRVAETLVQARVPARVVPICFPGRWFRPALLQDVLVHERLDGASLAARIQDALQEA